MSGFEFKKSFGEPLVHKKEAILFGEKEAYDEQEVLEAEKHLEQMRSGLGSLEAVSIQLDLESRVDQLGIRKEFFEVIRLLQSKLSEDLSALLAQGLSELKQNKRFNIFEFVVQRFLNSNDALYMHLMSESTAMSKFAQENPDDFLELTMLWRNLQEKMQVATVLKYVDSAGGLEGKFTLEQQEHRMQSAMLRSASSESPPPPGGPEDYEKIEPANLSDVVWPNGDTIRFSPAQRVEDDHGRERQFYNAEYEYTPKGSEQSVVVNLSDYIPGKHVIFEGTSGAITGTSLNPDIKYLGWASSLAREGNHLVALNLEHLQTGPQSMLTVFHELGHVYLFQGEEKKILAQPDDNEPMSRFKQIFSRFIKDSSHNTSESSGPRGIEMYQAEVDLVRQEIDGQLKEKEKLLLKLEGDIDSIQATNKASLKAKGGATVNSTLNPDFLQFVEKLSGEVKKLQLIQSLLLKHDFSSNELYYLQANVPTLNRLASIFHERMADAFALKQVHKLNNDINLSSHGAQERLKGSRVTNAMYYKEPRYVTGMGRGKMANKSGKRK